MSKIQISSGSPWEEKVGYCRAVRVGNLIEVAGTVAVVDGVAVMADDAFAQTMNIIGRVAAVLMEAGSSLSDVIRTRMFTTDITCFDEIARAHAHYFGQIRPVTSLYEVSKLVSPEFLIEIEFTAVCAE